MFQIDIGDEVTPAGAWSIDGVYFPTDDLIITLRPKAPELDMGWAAKPIANNLFCSVNPVVAA